jgi:hypothetical protein
MIFGLIFGAAIGQVLFPDNFAMGIGMGIMCLGLAIGAMMEAIEKKKQQEE